MTLKRNTPSRSSLASDNGTPKATEAGTARTRAARPRPPKQDADGSTVDSPSSVDAKDDGRVRLNVFLQEQGVASRRKADTLIEQGRVQVEGVVVKKLGTRIPADAEVKVDGKLLRTAPSTKVVFLLNKPDLCLTSRSDNQGRKTIFELPGLHRIPRNVQAVGRLDYRSEGLLLLTNDGDLAFALTHPRFSVEKSYAVLVADSVNAEDIDRLRKGVMLDDGFAKPLAVRLGNKEKLGATRGQWVEIVVTEGRNRLIRRMIETLGLKVVRLVRLAIGDLHLPERLGEGHVQPVVGAELAYLNRIKLEMLTERDGQGNKGTSPLTAEDKLKRRLKRKLKLNDEEYLEDRQRSSAASGARRRVRKETERKAPVASPAAAQRPTKNAPERPARPQRTAPTPRPTRDTRTDSKPAPRKTEEAPRANPGARKPAPTSPRAPAREPARARKDDKKPARGASRTRKG